MSQDSQPVRLYVKGKFTGFRRSRTNQTCHTALVTLDGVNSRGETNFYKGKRVAYIYRAQREVKGRKHRVIWGKIIASHGNSGVVRAKFRSNLPAKAMGATLRVMLYPSTV